MEDYILEEIDPNKRSILELLFGSIAGSIKVDYDNKMMIVKGINYEKFLTRISSMLNTTKINHIFDKKFTKWSEVMWRRRIINKGDRKISQLEVPLFFALEIYNLFIELGEFYNLSYYKNMAHKIYKNTWISNYDKKDKIKELTTVKSEYLNRLSYEPKDYQKEFILNYKKLKYIYDLDGYILSFDQGLGKTFTSVALAEILEKDKIIIVCPNSLKENWAYEIREYYSKYKNDTTWVNEIFISGVYKFNKFSEDTRYIIVNNESIPKIFPYIKSIKNPMIIVDESHNFRNLNSKRTMELMELKKMTECKDVLMMSGTPIKATPNEIVPALLMIDPYFNMELAEIYNKTFNIDKPGISSVVQGRFSRDIYRKTKEEVLNLPKKTIEIVKLPIKNDEPYNYAKIQKDIHERYNEIYEQRKIENYDLSIQFRDIILKYSDASNKETNYYLKYILKTTNTGVLMDVHDYDKYLFTKFLKSHVFPNINNKEEFKKADMIRSKYINMMDISIGMALGEILPPLRNQAYIDIINENTDYFIHMIKNNLKKTIIFTQFVSVANHTYDLLKSKGIGVVKIIGTTKNRMDIIQLFKNDDTIDVLVATSQTLSTGVTLTEATQMFFLGTPWRSADYNQAIDRIYRIGQTHDVHIYNILLDSEEKNITDRIQHSIDWSEEMFTNII